MRLLRSARNDTFNLLAMTDNGDYNDIIKPKKKGRPEPPLLKSISAIQDILPVLSRLCQHELLQPLTCQA